MKNRVKHIHFVGIGGSGMCGIAEVLHNQGYTVSGSDQAQSAVTRHLASLGVQVYPGHTAEHVQGADVVVTSTAVKKDNPEVTAAVAQQIPVIPRALMLAEIIGGLNRKKCLEWAENARTLAMPGSAGRVAEAAMSAAKAV